MEPFYSTIDHTIGDEIKNDESNRLFAVIQASGTQFKVAKDDLLAIDKLNYNEFDINEDIEFPKVMAVGSTSKTLIGRPFLQGAFVKGKIEEHLQGEKVIVLKKKKRKGYKRKHGHRRESTLIRITDISDPDEFEWDEKESITEHLPEIRKTPIKATNTTE